MKLDRTFSKELSRVNGDGSRQAKFSFLNPAREAAGKLSTINVFDVFNDIVREYGRATVGVCVAATILNRQDRLEPDSICWAKEVMKHWTNKVQNNVDSVVIRDGLHPTKIEQYASSFIRCTIEEP